MGSSPLARGLRERGRWSTTAVRDHPRSRGVYFWDEEFNRYFAGSSPLARGLRRSGWLLRRRPGIIPARAGFTSRRTALPCASADHPRSRGVYTRRLSISSRARGSSPLARGLHAPMKDSSRIQGIIPARAGFTMPPTMKRLGHEGSSPLARGLRYRGQPSTGHAGIIPARAGFTTVMGRCEKSITDHPRSRGVYGLRHFYQRRKHGSSPLARGLLLEGAPRQAIVRIIPARAGFTCHSVTLHASPWDHPRSRGVYGIRWKH